MVIVDDHLAMVCIGGGRPPLGGQGPVATTYCFQFRLARALGDPGSGRLSRLVSHDAALERVLRPPADRLIVLDPRDSLDRARAAARRHGVNLLLAELLGAASTHRAAVRVVAANVGRGWEALMTSEGIDFQIVEP